MTLKHWAWLTGLCAALAATSAWSQHREAGDVYLGAALGYNMAPDAEDEAQKTVNSVAEERGLGSISVSIDDGVFGWGGYGGYFVTDSLAMEVGYLGNADMDVELGGLNGDWSTSAFYAAAVAYIPMSDGSAAFPFVKAGFARWDSEISINLGSNIVISEDDDGTDLLVGAGLDVPVNEAVSIRGEYMLLLLDDDDGGSQHRFQVGVNFAL